MEFDVTQHAGARCVPPGFGWATYDNVPTVTLRAIVRHRGIANGAQFAGMSKADCITHLRARDEDNSYMATPPVATDTPEGGDVPVTPIRVKATAPAPSSDGAGAALAALVAPYLPTPEVDLDSIRAEATAAARAEVEALGLLRPIEIRVNTSEPVKVSGDTHPVFPTVVEALADSPYRCAWIYGPAGTGKTTMAKQVAEAMGGLPFIEYSLSGGVSESALLGRITADGKYVSTRLVDAMSEPGLCLFDECDGMDENVGLCLNAFLGNGGVSINGRGYVTRHPRFYVIAAGNTNGSAGSWVYTGRAKLDGAFLDRFAGGHVHMDYNRKLEGRLLAADPALAADLWRIRENAATARLPFILSTRMFAVAAQAIANGRKPARIVRRALGSADDATCAKLLEGVKIAPEAVAS